MLPKISLHVLFLFSHLFLVSVVEFVRSSSEVKQQVLTNSNGKIDTLDGSYNSSNKNHKLQGVFGRHKRDTPGESIQEDMRVLKDEFKKTMTQIRYIEETLIASQQWYELEVKNIAQTVLVESNESKTYFDAKLSQLERLIDDQIPNTIYIKDGPSKCRVWPDGKVPYEIDSCLTSTTRKYIEEAISDFHNKTCIRWIPSQLERAFVYFVKEDNSRIKKTEECYTGRRRVAIIREDFTKKEVLQQMAYILGFGDEHQRNDRDEYIKLDWNHCTMGDKYTHLNGGGYYDYYSIMHPSCTDNACLKRKGSSHLSCGNPGSLSILDAEKINEMYNCGECHSLRFQFPDQIDLNETELVVAFENAHENRKHICRYYEQAIRIGRGNATTGECHYWYAGKPHIATERVQFLTNLNNTKVQWVTRTMGVDNPRKAIPGGRDWVGESLYIARCAEEPQLGESVAPVWVYGNDTQMRMSKSDGSYHNCSSFDILAC